MMGVNNDNPCPICGCVYSQWIGGNEHICKICGNIYNTKLESWVFHNEDFNRAMDWAIRNKEGEL